MTLIVFFALTSLCCVLTVIVVGSATSNQDTIGTGFVLLIVWFFAAIFFQAGTHWQRTDIDEKFILIQKP